MGCVRSRFSSVLGNQFMAPTFTPFVVPQMGLHTLQLYSDTEISSAFPV